MIPSHKAPPFRILPGLVKLTKSTVNEVYPELNKQFGMVVVGVVVGVVVVGVVVVVVGVVVVVVGVVVEVVVILHSPHRLGQ